MWKSVSICTALILAAVTFADSAEARFGGGGGGVRMGGGGARIGGFSGARMGGWSGARMGGWSGARMGGWSGARAMAVAGPGRVGIAGPGRFAGRGRVAWAGRGAWAGRSAWAGNRWAGWRRGGGGWPWWGVGAGVALAAATWPYYGGYDSCVQWVPDYGWVNVCNSQYGGYGYWGKIFGKTRGLWGADNPPPLFFSECL